MAGSSVGSDIFAVLILLLVASLVLLLLRHFLPLRTTPAYLLTPIFLSLALPISIILLVPIDLASTSITNDETARGIWLPERVLLVAWRITYWLTFALTWYVVNTPFTYLDADIRRVILPLLGEYVDSGYRTSKDRIIYSLRSNARYQIIVLGCATVGLVYVYFQNDFAGTTVKSMVMALAYCWGLIQAIYLMGHGLVSVPRRLFRNASTSGRLRRVQSHAPQLHDRLEDSTTELNELESHVRLLRQRKNGISRDHQEWIEEIADSSSYSPAPVGLPPLPHAATPPIPAVITDRYLADLTRRLNRARHKRVRFADGWNRLVQEAVDLQAIIDATASRKLDLGKPSPSASKLEQVTILTPFLRYLLYSRVMPVVRITLGVISSTASICVIYSEIIKLISPRYSIISLTVVYHPNTESYVGFGGQLTAILWITYMCFAALASFDDVKVWGNRALVRRNTYGESACWYGGQIAKLTTPLAYNFVTLLSQSVYRKTAFFQFLGRLIVLTPLGKGFDYFFPTFILIPVCATLFNLYGRARNIFGYGIVDEDEEQNPTGFGTGGWREGRDLIERDLNARSDGGLSTPLEGRASSPMPGYRTSRATPERQPRLTAQPRSPHAYISPGEHSDTTPRQPSRLSVAIQAAESDDEGFLSGFAHRVRNTIDSVEMPDWIGKRPKWMGGVDGRTDSSSRADAGRGLWRWFGGRPADGRVRL